MAYEARPNSGSLFVNNKKTTDNMPDYTGDIRLSDELVAELAAAINSGKPALFRLAGWKKKTQKGEGWLSLSASSTTFKGTGKPFSKKATTETEEDPF